MNQYQRLKFYIACFFKDLKWKLCADKQIEEFEQTLVPEESVSGAEVKLIEDIIFMDEEEQKEQKPALEPRRTMLFISGRRRRCNFLNAWWYRRAILRNYHWGKQRGFTEYVADPYSPLACWQWRRWGGSNALEKNCFFTAYTVAMWDSGAATA